jgi:DNA polymerase V
MPLDQSHSSCSQSEPFALQVLGDDMEPEFPNGCIIIGEPNAVVSDGSYVIAKHNDEFIFRQLHINEESGQWTLSAIKKGLPVLAISGSDEVRARVVQSTNGRRKTRKFYKD